MSKLLCIVGTTGTGKTALAVSLAKDFPSHIISADSRQVYRGMNIVTGKDHPRGIKIHGIDLVNPTQSCSVSVWYDAVYPLISNTEKQAIVVGGTGLYIKALIHGIPTMSVPINTSLRAQLEQLPVSSLQSQLERLDPFKFNSLNHSDQFNPRRLIRAIEVASFPHYQQFPNPLPAKLVGLYYSDTEEYQKIVRTRVISRLKLGAIEETKNLISTSSQQALTAIGYRSIASYIEGDITEEQMIDRWVHDELSYAKRQLTFFRKLGGIWYDRSRVTDKEIIYDILQG